MLSYQHGYHAGGLADVHKHAALALFLARLAEKDKPLTYIETHAGRGLYDLASSEARKTGEAAQGILRPDVAGAFPPAHPYTQVFRAVQRLYGESFYPGSPLIARALLRDGDPLVLCELHPQEFTHLEASMAGEGVSLHKADGLETALKLAPPTPRRGMLFIDPSYEIKTDYDRMADFVLKIHRKWGVGVILLWYPILEAGLHTEMTRRLRVAGMPGFWSQEVFFGAQEKKRALGSGLVAINTPFGIENELDALETIFGRPHVLPTPS